MKMIKSILTMQTKIKLTIPMTKKNGRTDNKNYEEDVKCINGNKDDKRQKCRR